MCLPASDTETRSQAFFSQNYLQPPKQSESRQIFDETDLVWIGFGNNSLGQQLHANPCLCQNLA
jgi:hypothetical protein